MSLFTLLLGGDVVRTPHLDAQIAQTRVIAADSGMGHADMLGVAPELWVGDFDSVSEAMLKAHERVPREVFPPEKDKTDGELAIDMALARGATALVLVGAFGGARADHAYLHLTQAMRLAEAGIPTLITSGTQEGRPLLPAKRHSFDYPDGTMFSILGFTALSGLTVEGAKWPLDAVDMAFGSSLTMSNEVRGKLAITIEKGRALLVAHHSPEKKA